MSFWVGLTGGIGSGKTLVADYLARYGAGVIDTDKISHQMTQAGGAAIPVLEQTFGARILTAQRALDRDRMRNLVFSRPELRKQLESLLHPMILQQAAQECEALGSRVPYVVFVVPLLVETAYWLKRLQRVLIIDCSVDTQMRRVITRSGLTQAQVSAIIAAQATRQQRLQVAHDVLVNEGDHPYPIQQLAGRLHQHYSGLAAMRPSDSV